MERGILLSFQLLSKHASFFKEHQIEKALNVLIAIDRDQHYAKVQSRKEPDLDFVCITIEVSCL